jgi:hypothetical protein
LLSFLFEESGDGYKTRSFYDLYLSPNIIWVIKSRRTRWARHVDMCIQVFGERTAGKKPLGRPRHRWKNDVKMDIQ